MLHKHLQVFIKCKEIHQYLWSKGGRGLGTHHHWPESLWPQLPELLVPPAPGDWLLPPGEDSAGAGAHQTAGHVIGKIPCVRWLPTHTQTCVPDFAARWKMRKCARHRQKCWIQTKISTKDQHLLKVICKTSARLVLCWAFIDFACLFCITETVF